jgi:ligand-binding sensor domain-containing protein
MPLLGQNSGFYAQPSARQLSDEDGLPSMEVYHLYQDRKGYLWIGTADGICRYDGITFKKYTSENLTGRALTGTIEDSKGRIWCHNFTGQIVYVEAEKLQVENNWGNNISFGFPIIFIDRDSKLWAGSNKGLFQFEENNQKWIKVAAPTGSDATDIPLDIRRFDNEKYWYVNANSNVLWSADMLQWHRMKFLDEHGKPLLDSTLLHYPLLTVIGNRAVVFGRNRRSVFTLQDGVFRRNLSLEKELSSSISMTGSSECLGKYFCLSTYSGFYLLDTNYALVQKQPYFPDKAISKVITDKEGNWWVATLGSGIFTFPSLTVRQMLPQENIGHRTMKVVKGPGESVLAAMQNGLIYQINIQTTALEFQYKVPITKNVAAVYYWKEADRIVTGSDNILQFKPGLHNAEVFLNESCVKSLSMGPSGNLLYVSCFKAAIVENKSPKLENQGVQKSGKSPRFERLLRNNRCRTALFDSSSQTIWVAYQDGILYYQGGESKALYTATGQHLFATALAMHTDTLWVGTVSNGLFAFVQNKEVAHFTRKNLLHTEAITSLAVEPGIVWVGTYEGLQKINLSTKTGTLFNKTDGLPSNEINDILIADNKVWMATGKGIAVMPVNEDGKNRFKPRVYLSKLYINDVEQTMVPLLELPYSANNLAFQLSGISFRSREIFSFKYRLKGLDTAWQIAAATNNLARFISVPPGNYTFEALTVNEDGVESAQAESIFIQIEKPFWQTWWFYGLAGLSLTGLLAVFYQKRIKTIEHQNKEALAKAALKSEKEQVEQQLKISTLTAIKAQMNPHFIFNALNAIQNFFITDDKETANEYLGKFADLMRRILDMSNKELIELQEELEALKLYLELEQLRFGNTFRYFIHTDLSDATETILLPTMLIQPYVENAIKHGLLHKKQDRKLDIAFLQQGTKLKIKIEDNGVGRVRAASINQERRKYTSFSTKANQKRLDLLNNELGGELSVEVIDKYDGQNQPTGTIVWLNIPISTNN